MDNDALIVGAGPVGLVTALGLAQAGLKVTLIEAEEGIVESPRAMGYHWSVLEGLDNLGLFEDMKKMGFLNRQFSFQILRTSEQIRANCS